MSACCIARDIGILEGISGRSGFERNLAVSCITRFGNATLHENSYPHIWEAAHEIAIKFVNVFAWPDLSASALAYSLTTSLPGITYQWGLLRAALPNAARMDR